MRHRFYLDKLNELFAESKRKDPAVSLRAFARMLGLHPSSLVGILKGRRPFPLHVLPSVLRELNLTPEDQELFIESVYRSRVYGGLPQAFSSSERKSEPE